jgi:glycosyltransferase involved in cell wall biosynthesis
MRVALVHDYLNQYGGAERVLSAFCEMFPDAPIYTLVYDAKLTGFAFDKKKIKTSFLQKMPFAASRHRYFPVLMPYAVEQLDLSDYDLVLSDSGSYAKGVITKPGTLHISYCHTPHRYVWDNSHKLINEFGYPRVIKAISPFFMTYVRLWDAQAAGRVDAFIANSDFVKKRIEKYYNRDSTVIYPPVNCGKFLARSESGNLQKNNEYFLMVGRLVPYKKFSLAIRAFNKLGIALKIIGDGPERKNLEKIAKSNVEFLGLVSEQYLAEYYRGARALIFPQEEDFGVVAAESMASGRPVIAYRAGGALEIIKEYEDGVFFNEQTEESLIDAIDRFKKISFDPDLIRRHAIRFDKERFKEEIYGFVEKILSTSHNKLNFV